MGELANAVKDEKDPQKKTVYELIQQQKTAIDIALPKAMDAERFTRIVLTEVRRNPQLLRCEPMSLLGAVMLSAQLGLEPGPLGHCYLVPFGNQVTFIIGYQGMIELARRSGQISVIVARAVHQGDEFSYRYGLEDDLQHGPSESPGELTHVYALAKFKDGGSVFVVLPKAEVDSYMKRSPSARAKTSPWTSDYEAMAKKTAVRRLFPYLPKTVEAARAMVYGDETSTPGITADIIGDLAEYPTSAVEDAEVVESDEQQVLVEA